jgi:hypothetical protein
MIYKPTVGAVLHSRLVGDSPALDPATSAIVGALTAARAGENVAAFECLLGYRSIDLMIVFLAICASFLEMLEAKVDGFDGDEFLQSYGLDLAGRNE